MRKQTLIPISMLVSSIIVACSTTSSVKHAAEQSARSIASINELRNPETGRAYVDEAKDFEKQYADATLYKDLFGFFKVHTKTLRVPENVRRMGVTLSWVRSNPIAVFHSVRNSRSPSLIMAPIPSGSENKELHQGGTVNGSQLTVMVTRYKDVDEAFKATYVDDKGKTRHYFTVRNYNNKIVNSIGASFMLATDDDDRLNGKPEQWKNPHYYGDEKLWMRKLMGPDQMDTVRRTVRALTEQAINEGTYVAKRADGTLYNRLELVSRIARLVPIRLTQQYFGFSAPEDKLLKWSRAAQFEMFHNVKDDPTIAREAKESGNEMRAFVTKLVQERRQQIIREPGRYNDLLTRLLVEADKRKAPGFDDARVGIQLIGTLVGNVETSEAAIVQALQVLFQNPAALEGAKQAARDNNMPLLSGYIWDALRFDPVNPFVVRYAERTYVIAKGTERQTEIPKGSIVLLATHSAMMDPEMYPNPERIDPTRHLGENKQPEYYHLGDEYHRCLGDYVSKAQVPEIIRQILLLEDVKPVAGIPDPVVNPLGISDKGKMTKEGGLHREEQGFPERFDVEFRASARQQPPLQFVDPNFAYETLLNDYDRGEFRTCLAGGVLDLSSVASAVAYIPKVFENLANHKSYDYKHALLWCRLPKGFRECMGFMQKSSGLYRGYSKYQADEKHRRAFAECKAGEKGKLTTPEDAFYRQIFFGETIDVNRADMRAQMDSKGRAYEYEETLQFYDRYTFRECLMNPVGWKSFPAGQEKEMLFYARLPVGFRMCMGVPVTKRASALKKANPTWSAEKAQYEARKEFLPKCFQGELDEKSGKRMGALTQDEYNYYHKYLLAPYEASVKK